jgi:intracellular sulfur oxidation DsrE/DsrF family protein
MMALHKIFFMIVLLASTTIHAAEQIKYQLLLQVSEDSVEKLMMALNTAKFVQQEFGAPNVNVEIVVFGPGVQTLKYYAPIPVADRVREAKYNGIRIVACDYSMKAAKLKPAQMLREVVFVKSGAVEMMEKQSQGWQYIRP